MDGMEAPQPRHLVERSMDPVLGEVRHQYGQEELDEPRQAGHRGLQAGVAEDAA